MQKKVFWFITALTLICFSFAGVLAQQEPTGVTAVVVSEYANIRIIPALGAEVMASVPGGYYFEIITGRSADNEWLRIIFNGDEGWVHVSTLTPFGDMFGLPVADPRSIPYGGHETPRAGYTNATSDLVGTFTDWLRIRGGPGTGYPILANAEINRTAHLLGRTISNAWVQVNFDGVLGWVATPYIRLPVGRSIVELPIDGVLADSSEGFNGSAPEDYINTLKLLLDRIELAQPTLDSIRASWTDSALTGRASCASPFPARPSEYHVPNDLLAAYYLTLNPLITKFNDAMYNIRFALDMFIEACEQPGTANPVGDATIIGALEVVALADALFAELRATLHEIIPPPLEPGVGECLFAFGREVDILPLINLGQVIIDDMTPRKIVTGYCVDLFEGQNVIVESLQLNDSNLIMLQIITPIDNPTNFLGTGLGSDLQAELVLGPILVSKTERYLIIAHHDEPSIAPDGEFAIVVYEAAPGVFGTNSLKIDPITGAVIFVPAIQTIMTPGTPQTTATCPGTGLSCLQLSSCEQAWACYNEGNFSLRPDTDPVPCLNILCSSTDILPTTP